MKTLDDFVINDSDYYKDTFEELRKEYFKLKKEKVELLDKEVHDSKLRLRDKLLSKLFEDYKKLEASDTRFKELLMEEILTANYEILILSGERIPNLVENANTEQALIALSKAVYNMSRDDIRESRDYFENEKDAVFYDCLTANQKVNKKIIEMKGIKSISI